MGPGEGRTDTDLWQGQVSAGSTPPVPKGVSPDGDGRFRKRGRLARGMAGPMTTGFGRRPRPRSSSSRSRSRRPASSRSADHPAVEIVGSRSATCPFACDAKARQGAQRPARYVEVGGRGGNGWRQRRPPAGGRRTRCGGGGSSMSLVSAVVQPAARAGRLPTPAVLGIPRLTVQAPRTDGRGSKRPVPQTGGVRT